MLKTLLNEVKEYKKASLAAPLWVALEVILEVFIPFMLSIMVDQGIEKGNLNVVMVSALFMFLAAMLSLLAGALSGKYAAIASSGFAKNLRKAEYENIMNFSFRELDAYSTSSLITRMMTDVTNVQMAYMMIIRSCVRAPMMLVASLFMSFFINRRIALIFLGVILFLGIVLFGIIFIVRPIFEKLFLKYDDLNRSTQENITAIRVVKSFVRQDHEIDHFNKESDALFKIQRKAELILALNGPAMQLSAYTCIVLISWFGAHMIVDGTMTTGELLSLFTYIMSMLMALMMLSMVFVMVSMSMASGRRIAQVITQESTLNSTENGIKTIQDGSLTFESVYFNYVNDKPDYVLTDINLNVPAGSTLGILGSTGSSKTSFVQLIPRLYDVTMGHVEVGGIDVRRYDLQTLRDGVAMVLQKNVLFSGTIKENMRWGNPQATDEEIMEACRLAQADEFIQKMPDGYDTYIERGGANVSGGQRQRLCIARALLKKPKILILDDSTSAVDTRTDAKIRQAFLEQIPDTTKIIIAQRISSVQDADQIILLDDGKILAQGTHEQLLRTSPVYRETFEAQQKGDPEHE